MVYFAGAPLTMERCSLTTASHAAAIWVRPRSGRLSKLPGQGGTVMVRRERRGTARVRQSARLWQWRRGGEGARRRPRTSKLQSPSSRKNPRSESRKHFNSGPGPHPIQTSRRSLPLRQASPQRKTLLCAPGVRQMRQSDSTPSASASAGASRSRSGRLQPASRSHGRRIRRCGRRWR